MFKRGNAAERDQELLSAYLDKRLSDAERLRLEARLQAEPVLRAELESLRRTIQFVHAAPAVRPPRNFTLDPERYRGRQTSWIARAYPALRLATTVTALLLVVLLGGQLVLRERALTSGAEAPLSVPAAASLPASTASVQDKQSGGGEPPAQATAPAPESTLVARSAMATQTPVPGPAAPEQASTASTTGNNGDTAATALATAIPEASTYAITGTTPLSSTEPLPAPTTALDQQQDGERESAPDVLGLATAGLAVLLLMLAVATYVARRG